MNFRFRYLLFTHRCCSCGKILNIDEDKNICPDCLKSFIDISQNEYIIGQENAFFAMYDYSGRVSQMLRRLKSNPEYDVAYIFSSGLCNLIRKRAHEFDCDIITCVPRYKKHKNVYNQSSLLAGIVARILKKEYKEDLLIKKRNVQSQTVCRNRASRLKNVRGAYVANKEYDLKNKSILIIDDIYTTGATLRECTYALKDAGAGYIAAATVSHGAVYDRGTNIEYEIQENDVVTYDISDMNINRVKLHYKIYKKFFLKRRISKLNILLNKFKIDNK